MQNIILVNDHRFVVKNQSFVTDAMEQMLRPGPTVLVILDGFGYSPHEQGNAIAAAHMAFFTWLQQHYPSILLQAAGQYVGLLPGMVGNSQVGHLTLGAGRVVWASIAKVVSDAQDGRLLLSQTAQDFVAACAQSTGTLHLIGLVSDGGVHSAMAYLTPLIKHLHSAGVARMALHAILDGRDCAPRSAAGYLTSLMDSAAQYGISLASVHGRAYAMDRDKQWDRTDASVAVLRGRVPVAKDRDWRQVLDDAYAQDLSDEFVMPTLIHVASAIKPGDAVLIFNVRPDRVHQILQRLVATGDLRAVASMASVDASLRELGVQELYEQEVITETLLDSVAAYTQGALPVVLVAETEKAAHVTYFFRGMSHVQLPHEHRILVPSLGALHYQDVPAMSAAAITELLCASLVTMPNALGIVNYANADMVGHTGDFAATVRACQTLDVQLRRLFDEVVMKRSGTLIVTADHGNAEHKIDQETGNQLTAHTANPVPLVWVHQSLRDLPVRTPQSSQPIYGLAVVAPSLLDWLGIPVPECMEKPLNAF